MNAIYNLSGEIIISFSPSEYEFFKNSPVGKTKFKLIKLFTYFFSKSPLSEINKKYSVIHYKTNGFHNIKFSPKSRASAEFAVKTSEDKLIILIEQLYLRNCFEKCLSSIYLYKGEYYLIITPFIKTSLIEIICSEFCTKNFYGKKVSRIKNAGSAVLSHGAIESLGRVLSNNPTNF